MAEKHLEREIPDREFENSASAAPCSPCPSAQLKIFAAVWLLE
ncbi:MAG: hypothetical protein ACR2G4_02830 [Pyrinomonadaceae bacterium]